MPIRVFHADEKQASMIKLLIHSIEGKFVAANRDFSNSYNQLVEYVKNAVGLDILEDVSYVIDDYGNIMMITGKSKDDIIVLQL